MKDNKLFKSESNTPQNVREDGNLESDSFNIEKKDMNNGTRDTDGGNAQGEEDEKTDYLIV